MISMKVSGKKKAGPALDGKTLVMDCRGCDLQPDYSEGDCIRCMCDLICVTGDPERILLRSGLETEYSGDAVRIVNGIASAYAMQSGLETRNNERCATCGFSPIPMADRIWGSLSTDYIDGCINRLKNVVSENEQCDLCINRTRKTFEAIRDRLTETSKDALRSAYRIMGA